MTTELTILAWTLVLALHSLVRAVSLVGLVMVIAAVLIN